MNGAVTLRRGRGDLKIHVDNLHQGNQRRDRRPRRLETQAPYRDLRGESDVEPATVRCDDRCAFGLWLNGPTIDGHTRSGKPYQVIHRLHAEFHQAAATVLESALAGRKEHATQILDGEFRERSEKLVRALTKWKGELQNSTVLGR